MIQIVRAKLHGIRVTGADLNYHGSVTLDPEYCDLAGLYPMEFVDIWNKNNGSRISTYIILGEAGSRCCIVNGAAARTCQTGDELIISASEYCEPERLYDLKPIILTFLPDNRVDQILQYDVYKNERRSYNFRIVGARGLDEESCRTPTSVDVTAIRGQLATRGWRESEIDAFCNEHFAL